MRRLRPSLVGRLTLAFVIAHAVALLLFHVALWPVAVSDGDDPVGPDLLLSMLERDMALQGKRLALELDSDVIQLAHDSPGLWFMVQAPAGGISYGPVPEDVRDGNSFFDLEQLARRPDLDVRGRFGGMTAATIDTDAGQLVAVVGDVDPRAIGFGRWLVYNYLNDRLWLPFFTALFTLAGAIAAVPIVLRSIRPTVEAASLVGPRKLQKRLPEEHVVRELLPIVRAFNEALERLSEAFETKRRFIADVAHELRTPLAVLNMQVDSLHAGPQKTDIQRLVYRLEQMVGQMLDSERMELTLPRRQPLDLVELAKEAVADIAPLALSSGYEIVFHPEIDNLPIEGDPDAIQRALANLLGNAVAHGGGKGVIDVRVLKSCAIDIADEGPGVPPTARERIFEPFHRERWDRDGCGLGLHLVSEIMRSHGGRVSILNSAAGALFRLEFGPEVKSGGGSL